MPRTKGGKRKPRKLPVFLTDEEEKALLTQPNPCYITGQRNRLIMNFILHTGARLQEPSISCGRT